MRIRLAKLSDSRAIAEIHYFSRKNLSGGFFSKTSILFLRQYYRILLNDPYMVIVCVEDNSRRICGFVSASLDSARQHENIRKNKVALAIALLPSMLKNPGLILDAISRFRSLKQDSNVKFITSSGARGEFWAWDIRLKISVWAVLLYKSHLQILSILGVEKMYFEVDSDNDKILNYHKKNGAYLYDQFSMSDGRVRLLMYYDLVNKNIR
jgi:hypothetical protein